MSSTTSGRPAKEVFLSFRGDDTRHNFADFLHTMLTQFKIMVYRDEEDLVKGREILPQLIQAIEQSNISIPVISKDYASSKTCLVELKQMVKCMKEKNHIIIPIFYHVKPSDVRDCTGPFEKVLDEHQRHALRWIADLTGCHLLEGSVRFPGKIIAKIVREVELMLKKRDLIVTNELVGVDPHVQEIMAKLKVDYCDGQMVKIGDTCEKVLIHGIPGVGKTILAKCVYNKLNHLYDACCFLEKIQEEIKHQGVPSVQEKLIHCLHKGCAAEFHGYDDTLTYIRTRFLDMKVLLLLDDVKDDEQLHLLAEKLDWLGPGSRVIVTSRRCNVLQRVHGAESYVLGTMKQDNALTLFCKHAFETDSPPEKFKELATKIVSATDELPLALEKAGKSLFKQTKEKVWTERLTSLKEAPDESVHEAFLESYITLNNKEQNIFLDIACFFNGKDKRIPSYMWDDLQFYSSTSIQSLHAKSLVEIREDKEIHMGGILKTFGREIVKRENSEEPCKRSRLCNPKEALDVLEEGKGTKCVEALGLEFGDGYEGNVSFKDEQFDGLQKLRFLKLDQAHIQGNFGNRFQHLRWLDWQGCPKIFEDHLNLNLQNLVILDLSGSQVCEDWSGWELLAEVRKLKVLNLTGCVQLTATPTFPPSMELERLVLEGCSKLAIIHPSVSNLEKLVSLNMKGCSLLRELPDLGPLISLKELVIDGTSISQINVQEGSMMKLKSLSACNCKDLTDISGWIGYLKFLKYLSLDGSGIHTLPESIGSLDKLKTPYLKNCG